MSRSGLYFAMTVIAVVYLALIVCMACRSQSCVTNAQVTLTGNLRGANGIPSANSIITLTPSQQGYIAGCGINLATVNTCATSIDGSVVGLQNPQTATVNTTSGSGSLPPTVYYTVYEWYDAAGHVTLESPETRTTLSATGSLVVNPPSSGVPALAVGMNVFISTSSGTETLQGQTTGTASFVQSTALTSGSSPASTNTTLCQVTANDAVWPTGTGYNVSMVTVNGNPVPSYPMQWQLIGPGTTINLSNGLPYYHGVVYYPVPILSAPQNHGTQSISGSLNFGGYSVTGVGKLGVGTNTPGWPIDVENGLANFETGFLLGGVAPSVGECAASTDGIAIDTYVSCALSGSAYSIMEGNGTPATQRTTVNFLPPLTVADSSSPARTNVGVSTVGNGGSVVEAAGLGTTGNCAMWSAAGIADSGTICGSAAFIAGTGTATLTPGIDSGTGSTFVCAASHVCDSLSGTGTLTLGTSSTNGVEGSITLPVSRTNVPNCTVNIYSSGTYVAPWTALSTSTTVITLTASGDRSDGQAYTVIYWCGGN